MKPHTRSVALVLWLFYLFVVLLTHVVKGVKSQFVEPAFILTLRNVSNALVGATAMITDVCYNGLTVPIRNLYNLK